MVRSSIFFGLAFLLDVFGVAAQSQPHLNAHAHNDYEHSRPLLDALDNGFTSIEADVHLAGGKLLVSHERPGRNARSLAELYLDPLDSVIAAGGGYVYPDFRQPIILLVDIKTEGEATYKALIGELSRHKQWLHTTNHSGAIQIVISGNRPVTSILNDAGRLVAIDGRPADLGKGYRAADMPLISESYGKVLRWNGKGSPSSEDLVNLRGWIQKVHDEGKRCRLWGTPDNEATWSVLFEAGMDLINTDQLAALNKFLRDHDR